MPIAAGSLRHRLTFQEKVQTTDELNAKVTSWANTRYRDVPANVAAITGRESSAADQIANPSTLRAVIRAGMPITPAMRALWRMPAGQVDRILSIDAVLPGDEPDAVVLLCSQGLNSGGA